MKKSVSPSDRRGFTLIELLVVVVVIAALAALALVNLLEAQARSKVARAEADIKTLRSALEMYRVDAGSYPPAAIGDLQLEDPLVRITTPVAYLGEVPRDVFGPAPFDFAPELVMLGYSYKDRATTSTGMPAETFGELWAEPSLKQYDYIIHSCGPNTIWDVTPYVDFDPTNGSVSRGDIIRFGPM